MNKGKASATRPRFEAVVVDGRLTVRDNGDPDSTPMVCVHAGEWPQDRAERLAADLCERPGVAHLLNWEPAL